MSNKIADRKEETAMEKWILSSLIEEDEDEVLVLAVQ